MTGRVVPLGELTKNHVHQNGSEFYKMEILLQ